MSSPEDADKAYNLAMKHSQSGNLDGALKWARKAMAIDPTSSKAKVLLTSLEKGHMPGSTQASSSTSTGVNGHASGSSEGTRKRTAPATTSSSAREKSEAAPLPAREFTKEQARVVAQVNKAGKEHDYYGVLLLKKDDKPDENAIKKGYRKVSRRGVIELERISTDSDDSKLALQLHPDKNGAPGADEAFKSESEPLPFAVAMLTLAL